MINKTLYIPALTPFSFYFVRCYLSTASFCWLLTTAFSLYSAGGHRHLRRLLFPGIRTGVRFGGRSQTLAVFYVKLKYDLKIKTFPLITRTKWEKKHQMSRQNEVNPNNLVRTIHINNLGFHCYIIELDHNLTAHCHIRSSKDFCDVLHRNNTCGTIRREVE